MSYEWKYVPGDWNLICDVCSKKIKASKSKERWDGFRVCEGCWEPRQSLDFVKAREDHISIPFARPIPANIFVVCTPYSRQSRADVGSADCATVGVTTPNFGAGL